MEQWEESACTFLKVPTQWGDLIVKFNVKPQTWQILAKHLA